MSGGHYGYAYLEVQAFADALIVEQNGEESPDSYIDHELRKRFRSHLHLIAAAMRAIEWNDSLDGHSGEQELISHCLGIACELYIRPLPDISPSERQQAKQLVETLQHQRFYLPPTLRRAIEDETALMLALHRHRVSLAFEQFGNDSQLQGAAAERFSATWRDVRRGLLPNE